MTRAQKEKGTSSKFDWWVECDDLNALHRLWLGGSHDPSEHSYSLTCQNSALTLTQDSLYRSVWKYFGKPPEKDVKIAEISLEFPARSSDTQWYLEVNVMIDVQQKHPYALHVIGKTTTSSVDAYKLLPSEL